MFGFNEFNTNTVRIEDPKWENWARVLIIGLHACIRDHKQERA